MNLLKIFYNLSSLQKFLVTVVVAIFLYSISFGVSANLFKSLKGGSGLASSLPGPATSLTEDPNAPKTEECPLNGSMHTKEAKAAWEKRRPLAVMIENHQDARPQSGLSSADVVYEAVAEGGITRFMALFYCNVADVQVGPVRSARTYYIDWLSEYDALYAHVGGANDDNHGPADALGQIIKYGIKDLNQFSIGFPSYWRDPERLGHPVATEHTMYSTTAKLWAIGEKRGWTAKDKDGVAWDKNFTPWKFKKDSPGGNNSNITINFWENQPEYVVNWIYDTNCNCYKRKNGGVDHMDLDNKKQLETKTVVVQFEKESNANDGYPGNVHLLYGTTGSGKALIFSEGRVIEGHWSKQSRTARTKYLDDKNKEVEFIRGPIWITTVPEGAKVSY